MMYDVGLTLCYTSSFFQRSAQLISNPYPAPHLKNMFSASFHKVCCQSAIDCKCFSKTVLFPSACAKFSHFAAEDSHVLVLSMLHGMKKLYSAYLNVSAFADMLL